MKKTIDPVERALDNYFMLNAPERRIFDMAVKHVDRFAAAADRYIGTTEEKPRRGRPAGSKNRKHAEQSDQIELVEKLFGHNGAVSEGL